MTEELAKNGISRWVLMLCLIVAKDKEELAELLEKYKEMRKNSEKVFSDVIKKHSKVAHLSKHGKKRVKKKNIKRFIKILCKEIGIKDKMMIEKIMQEVIKK